MAFTWPHYYPLVLEKVILLHTKCVHLHFIFMHGLWTPNNGFFNNNPNVLANFGQILYIICEVFVVFWVEIFIKKMSLSIITSFMISFFYKRLSFPYIEKEYLFRFGARFWQLKFIYSEKATKFCEISTLLLSVCTVDKSKVEISQNFVAFSEHTNFNITK